MMADSDRLSLLTAQIAQQDALVSQVILLVRSTLRGPHKTLRQAMESAIREHFDFDLLYCPGCSQFLPPTRFPRDRSRPSGRYGCCIQCKKDRRLESYWSDPDYHRTQRRAQQFRSGQTVQPRKPVKYTPKSQRKRRHHV